MANKILQSLMQEAVQAQRAQVIAAVKEGSEVSLTGCKCRKGCLTAADLHLRSASFPLLPVNCCPAAVRC